MASRNIQKLLNEALSVCEVGHTSFDDKRSRQSYGLGPYALNIIGDENRIRFDLSANKLLEACFSTTLSKSKFINILVPLLRDRKAAGVEISQADAADFVEYCNSLPINEYRVIRELHGCHIGTSEKPISFGCFTIYDWQRQKELVVPEYYKDKDDFWGNSSHELLVECVVSARDEGRALEIADVLFGRLELALWFMIGHRTSKFEIGIIHYSGARLARHYVIQPQAYTVGSKRHGAFEKAPLNDPYFLETNEQNARLVALIERQESNLQNRLLRSIEWIGQSLVDESPASAFIKATTALEMLFSQNEKGIVTPSIMAQISENCAQIIGSTTEQCLDIEKEIKRLYSIRSAVVHSGKNEVHLNDLANITFLARKVVLTILAEDQYYAKESVEALYDMLKIRRYQYGRQA
jgi:hypothetical protein